MTENLYYFRIGIDVFIILGYLMIYIFHFYHLKDGGHKDNSGKSSLDNKEGLMKVFWAHTARTMWISIIIEEIFLYYFSVRPAKKRAIYQEFNLKEKYWRKGDEFPM